MIHDDEIFKAWESDFVESSAAAESDVKGMVPKSSASSSTHLL